MKKQLRIGVASYKQLETVCTSSSYSELLCGGYIDGIYAGGRVYRELDKRQELNPGDVKRIIRLPEIIKNDFVLSEYLEGISYCGLSVSNLDGMACVLEAVRDGGIECPELVCEPSLYAYNSVSRTHICGEFKNTYTNLCFDLPEELTLKELAAVLQEFENEKFMDMPDNELCIYGHQQVMVTAQCVQKNRSCCDRVFSVKRIRDDKGNVFYSMADCENCYNIVYNGVPLFILDRLKGDICGKIKRYRVNFSIEDEASIVSILNILSEYYLKDKMLQPESYTTGHILKGIE